MEKLKDLSVRMKKQKQLEWRRRQVFELSSKGHSQTEIANTLQISEPTISRDLSHLRQQSKQNIRNYIDEKLPEEYEKCLVGLTAILREAWTTSQQTEDKREKIQTLSLAKEVYSAKLDLLTNCEVVDDVIRFVNNHKKKKVEEQQSQEAEHHQQIATEEDKEAITTDSEVF